MATSVKQIFEEYSVLDNTDKRLVSRVISFGQRFINKNISHTQFFGGNLLGTPSIRWTAQDTKEWLEEVLLIEDIVGCQADLFELDEINKDFAVSSSLFNLSIPWCLHILNRITGEKNKEEAMISCLVTGMSMHLCTFMFRRFKYPANVSIAQALFESLDRKNDLKRKGSWIALMRDRTWIFLNTEGRYPDIWRDMTDDRRIVIMCNEVNGNIRNTVNVMTSKFYDVKESQDRILSSSKLGSLDGETVIKDYIRNPDKMRADMISVATDPNSLIKNEVIEFTMNLSSTVKEENLIMTLNYLSDNLTSKDKHSDIIDRLVIYLLTLKRTNKVDFSNVPMVVHTVRSMFRSSGTSNKDVIFLKHKLLVLVKRALPRNRDLTYASTVNATIIYLTIRTMSLQFYK